VKNKQTELMGNAPVSKAILQLSIPVVCGMMVQVLYNLVDTFFIGKLQDQNQLAAASITTPVFMIMMAISTVVATGAGGAKRLFAGAQHAGETWPCAVGRGAPVTIGPDGWADFSVDGGSLNVWSTADIN
jgi:hypothetical protein